MTSGKRRAFVCDIDNTCADTRHRSHFLNRKIKDWDGFHKAAGQDKPVEAVRTTVQALEGAGLFPIFLTARPEAYRTQTGIWLARHGFIKQDLPHLLIMKPDNHLEENAEYKRRAYRAQIEPRFRVVLWLDDSTAVIRMVRDSLKLPCFQTQEGPEK